MGAELAAVPRALHAPERQLGVRGGHAVDEHGAGVEVAHEALLLVGVAAPHVRPQAEAGGVGQRHGGVGVGHAVEGGDRAEHLLVVHAHGLGHAGHDRRRVVPARAGGPLAAAQHRRPPGHRVGHQLLDVAAAPLGGEGAHVGLRVNGVAQPQRRHPVDEAAFELVGDGVEDDEALGGDAALPVVLAAGHGRHPGGLVEVGRGGTTNGSLPPSSSTVGLISSPAMAATARPARSLPVRVAARRAGRAAPARPGPTR